MLKEWKYILLLGLMLAVNIALAANSISKEKWAQLTSGKEYSYRHEIEKSDVVFKNNKGNVLSKLLDFMLQFFASPNGKILIVATILCLFGYAIIKIILNERRRQQNKKPAKETIEKETENLLPKDLMDNNWESLLQEAQNEGNSRMVIRFSYLYFLQLLQKKQFIQYRVSKTNDDYYYEIKEPELRQNFKILSRQYEWVWYGEYEIAQDKFDQFMNIFQHSLKSLKK